MEIKKKKVGARGRGREKRENRDGQIQKETDRQTGRHRDELE